VQVGDSAAATSPPLRGGNAPIAASRTATTGASEALHQMEDHRVKRLPVIENHRLVGIITEAGLARNVNEHRLAEFVEMVYTTA
jgi:CBS domain-containing protein